jgi:hypothetical protein
MDEELGGSEGMSIDDRQQAEDEIANEEVAKDAKVLSSLLESVEISGSAPGPVQNILREMGVFPPKLHSEARK